MTAVDQVAPRGRPRELEEVLASLAAAPQLAPFTAEAVGFCDALSRRLFRDPAGRTHPELLVLAYWLRRASVERLREAFAAEAAGTAMLPRGLVFHVPPANVDTMAVYSLALSLLVGNRNLVRISPRRNPQMDALLSALDDTLRDDRFADVRAGTMLVGYGHEEEPTALASLAGDVRVLWGGDETVTRLRRFPLRPDAKEIVFPDRFSFAAIDAGAWSEAPEPRRDELAQGFFDDAYWFDQMGCASPRLVVWRGSPAAAEEAGRDLYARVARIITERGYAIETGAAISKLTYAFGAAADRPVVAADRARNELTVLRLETLAEFDRTHPGAGLFFEAVIGSLAELAEFVTRKDQTMTAFGFTQEELRAFVAATNGRGVDRVVPFGRALAFDRLWDGMDLLAELTRRVVVVV